MSANIEQLIDGTEPGTPEATRSRLRRSWFVALGLFLPLLALLLFLFQDTYLSIVNIWSRSETFAHGFIIAPITLFLIWRIRHDLARIEPEPSLLGALLLVGLGFGWLLGDIADVNVVQHFMVVIAIQALVIGVFGLRVAWAMAFPLAYLLFAVPVGEALVPPLMDLTAVFTVKLVQLSGIPIYSDGLFFSLPSGNWSVVEGCSGVRYLIASLALGTLYAYLMYVSLWRRLVFIVFAGIVPIVANVLRAYMIVMIGHLSDMQHAVGVDHLLYGWVFFGIVIFIMFWIGAFFSDHGRASDRSGPPPAVLNGGGFRVRGLLVALACLPAFAVWPALAKQLEGPPADQIGEVTLAVPEVPGWTPLTEPLTDWVPRYIDKDQELHLAYQRDDGAQVGLYLAFYVPHQDRGKLITTYNVMVVQKHPVWQMPRQSGVTLEDAPLERVVQAQLRSPNHRLLAWHWYWVAERHLTNPYLGKAWEAYSRLFSENDTSAGIVVYAPYDLQPDEAAQVMREFLNDAFPALNQTLKAGAPQ